MDLSLLGQSRDAERRRPAAHPVLAPGSPTPRERGPTRRSTQLNTLLWLPQSGPSVDGHFLSLRRSQTLPCPGLKKILILLRFLVGFRHSSTNFHALQSRKSRKNKIPGGCRTKGFLFHESIGRYSLNEGNL